MADRSGRVRRWTSRAVLAVAAIASVATSRPRWQKAAELPGNAPTSTPRDGDQGIVVAVEASELPTVICRGLTGGDLELAAMQGTGAKLTAPRDPGPAHEVVHAQYVCPPGGVLAEVVIHGQGGGGGGCGNGNEAPEGTFLRITRLAATKLWTEETTANVALHSDPSNANMLVARFRVVSRGQTLVDVQLAPGIPEHTIGQLRVYESTPGEYDVSAPWLVAYHGPVRIQIHATTFGPCGVNGCAPPAGDDAARVEDVP